MSQENSNLPLMDPKQLTMGNMWDTPENLELVDIVLPILRDRKEIDRLLELKASVDAKGQRFTTANKERLLELLTTMYSIAKSVYHNGKQKD